MGEEKLDNAVYLIRGLWDLADLASRDGRPRDGALGRGAGLRPHRAVRRRLVPARGPRLRRLARRSGQPPALPAPLDRRDADGGRADPRRPGRAWARAAGHAAAALGLARGALLRRRLGLLPHRAPRLRRRARRPVRAAVVHAEHVDHRRRRGQLRAPGPEPSGAGRRRSPPSSSPASSSPPRCRRSPRRRRRTGTSSTARSTSGRWCCRPGAPTGPPGRSSTSSSACGRISGAAAWRSCRRCRPTRRSPGATSAWATAGRSTWRRGARAGATARGSASRACASRCASATRCPPAPTVRRVTLDGDEVGYGTRQHEPRPRGQRPRAPRRLAHARGPHGLIRPAGPGCPRGSRRRRTRRPRGRRRAR